MNSVNALRRPSLAQRIRGPNARPVDQLVERATLSAAHVRSQYADFARQHVQQIADLMAVLSPLSPASEWQALTVVVQDLRSSSITCGNAALSWIARAWERALDWQYRHESKLMAVMQLHLDALRLAASKTASDAELRALADRLTTMVKNLNPTA